MTITTRQLKIALVVIGLAALVITIERLIVTDKERIKHTVKEMQAAVESADADALFSHISSDFQGGQIVRQAWFGLAKRFFDARGGVNVHIRQMEIQVSDDTAVVVLEVFARSAGEGYEGMYGASQWSLDLRREQDEEWRVVQITPLRVGDTDFTGWDVGHPDDLL